MGLNHSPSDFIRVLVVTSDDFFHCQNSVTLTVGSIFSGFPKKSIFQIVCEDFNGRRTGRYGNNTFVVGHDSICIGRFIKSEREEKTSLPKPDGINNKKSSIKNRVLKFLSALYQSMPYKIDKRLDAFIKESSPQVLYLLLTPSRNNDLAYRISRRYNIPIVSHFYDDWQKVYLTENKFLKPFKFFFSKKLHKIMKQSSTCLCISDKMCKDYKKRFPNIDFIPLMHSVEDLSQIPRLGDDSIIRLIYSGSLYLGRDESLRLLCEEISHQGMRNVTFDVYCPEAQWKEVAGAFANYSFVSYKGLVPQNEMFFFLRQADFLVFLESLDSRYLTYSALSLSTKVPEYLSSKVPIIALGNKNQGSIEYLLSERAAYVATDVHMLAKVCADAFTGVNKSIYTQNARKLYEQRHSKKNNSALINSVLIRAVEGS